MGASFNAIRTKAEEGSGCIRGGARFQLEKRQRIGEGLGVIKTQDRKGQPHRMNRPYSEDEDNQAQAVARMTIRSNPRNNVHMPPRTTPNSRKTPSPTSTCPTSQKQSSSRSTYVGRWPRMAGDDMKLPLFHGNGTNDPEQY